MGQEYIYEYKNGKRIRNLGFLKVSKNPDKCSIEIYARDIDEVKGIIFEDSNGRKYLSGWGMEEPIVPVESEVSVEPSVVAIPQQPTLETEEHFPRQKERFEKIQRKDLSRLPRKEWRLANNSFLLHGFYNYHHLLYIEEEDDIWVGVPGIFHEKEKLAASTFGFTHFRRLVDVEVELEENEMNTYEDFGYWCRQIQNPKV